MSSDSQSGNSSSPSPTGTGGRASRKARDEGRSVTHTSQSCDRCRMRKVRCEGQSGMSCNACQRAGDLCTFNGLDMRRPAHRMQAQQQAQAGVATMTPGQWGQNGYPPQPSLVPPHRQPSSSGSSSDGSNRSAPVNHPFPQVNIPPQYGGGQLSPQGYPAPNYAQSPNSPYGQMGPGQINPGGQYPGMGQQQGPYGQPLPGLPLGYPNMGQQMYQQQQQQQPQQQPYGRGSGAPQGQRHPMPNIPQFQGYQGSYCSEEDGNDNVPYRRQ